MNIISAVLLYHLSFSQVAIMKSVFSIESKSHLSHVFVENFFCSWICGFTNGRNSPSSLSFTASDEQSLIRLQIHTFPSVWWEVTSFL